MKDVLAFAAVVVTVEAICAIIAEENIFAGLRARLKKLPGFLGWYAGGLAECHTCLTVWASFGAAFLVPFEIVAHPVPDWILKVFAIHRAAVILHEIVKRVLLKEPIFISLFRFPETYDDRPREPVDENTPRESDDRR